MESPRLPLPQASPGCPDIASAGKEASSAGVGETEIQYITDVPHLAAIAFCILLFEYTIDCVGQKYAKLEVDATVSNVRKPRTVYLTPNAALWLAVYLPDWRMGAWNPVAAETRHETFDQYVDKYYIAPGLSKPHIKALKKVMNLTYNILRHSNITYFAARYPSILSAAAQSGNSPRMVEGHYLDCGRTREDAKRFYAILPKGWKWSADKKSFIPPAGWIRPQDGPCRFQCRRNVGLAVKLKFMANPSSPKLVDVHALHAAWPSNNPPGISTLRRWTRERRLPYIKQGRFIYYDVETVAKHLRYARFVPARR